MKEADTPLDQAIFSSTNNAIYGVRGKWVYRFNATTGKVEASSRWADDILGISSICDIGGTIYVCGWESLKNSQDLGDTTYPVYPDNRDIFTINPTTLAATNTHLWRDAFKTGGGSPSGYTYDGYYLFGPARIMAAGSLLWGVSGGSDGGNGQNLNFFIIDPANAATHTNINAQAVLSSNGRTGPRGMDMVYDADNGRVGLTQPLGYAGGSDKNIRLMNAVSGAEINYESGNSQAAGLFLTGICYYPTADKFYAVRNTNSILKWDSPTDTLTDLNLLDSSANPMRIKYNPADGLIYIPTWNHDTVAILDPATDTITTEKTGFFDPIDVVFTASKKFAVQNSGVPLREIV